MSGTVTSNGPPDDWDPFAEGQIAEGKGPQTSDPGDLGAQLAAAQTSMVGDPPTVALPSDGMVMLSRGLLFEDEWQRQALMRETTGADEEILSRFDLTKPGAMFLYWDKLLVQTVLSIGNINFEDMPVSQKTDKIRQLLIGDRESLFLAIVRATWGPIRTIEEVRCPMCGEMSDQNIVLDQDFPFTTLDEPDKMWYEVKLRKGDTVEMRLPTGDDIMQLANNWKTDPTPAERNTVMLGRLLSQHDGTPIKDPVKFAKSLSTPDRQTLITFAVDTQPGPRLGGVETSCGHCEEKFFLELGLARLLQLGG